MNCFFVICASLVLVAYSAAQNEGDVSSTTAASDSSSTTLTPQQEKLVEQLSGVDISECTMKVEGCGISNAALTDIVKGKSMEEWKKCGPTFAKCLSLKLNNAQKMSSVVMDFLRNLRSSGNNSNSGSGDFRNLGRN